MQKQDRAAFLDSMLQTVATNLWRELSTHARTVLPVVGSHAALYGCDEPAPIARICEYSGLIEADAEAAADELAGLGLVRSAHDEAGGRCLMLVTQPAHDAETQNAIVPTQEMLDSKALKVYGNLTINIEESSPDLMRLTDQLAELLESRTSDPEHENDRVERKVVITTFREPEGDEHSSPAYDPEPDTTD